MIKLKDGDVIQGQIEFYTNGNASLKKDDENIFIHKKNTKNSLHLDTVNIEIFQRNDKTEGKVTEVVSRFKTQFVGRAIISKNIIFVRPDNNKIYTDFYIRGGLVPENNQKVIVELVKWKDSKSPQGKIVQILGNSGDNNTEMNSIMAEYGLPTEFPKDVIKESESVPEVISEKEISRRLDLRNIITIGIDPFDSKDADDTIGLEIIDDGYIVYINIADVSHYVKEGSLMDSEAYLRGTSCYLVDRCISMLPERLSNNICSLKFGSDKLSFSVIITFDGSGKILKTDFKKSIININKDYSYEMAQQIIENGSDNDVDNVVLVLDRLAKIMRKERVKDSLDFNSSEVKFILDKENKKPIGLYFKEQKDSNKLIEEFMLLANKSVAKFLKEKIGFSINRSHNSPNIDKLTEVKNMATALGYELDISEKNLKSNINKLLKEIKGTSEETMLSTLITRSMSKAFYTTQDNHEEYSHWGLSFKYYTHFTSPIRRYPDILAHRLLEEAIGWNK
jgi:ribonuclease R